MMELKPFQRSVIPKRPLDKALCRFFNERELPIAALQADPGRLGRTSNPCGGLPMYVIGASMLSVI